MKIKALALTTIVLSCAQNATAQDDSSNDTCISGIGNEFTNNICTTSSELLGKLDLAVPENALFSLMNSTPDTVIRPKVGDRFMISVLPQLTDMFGNEEYAIGVEWNPGLQMMPDSFTMADLIGDAEHGNQGVVEQLNKARAFSNFKISAAATKSGGESQVSRYGVGINYVRDEGAPLYAQVNYADCIRQAYTPADGEPTSPSEDLINEIAKASKDTSWYTPPQEDPDRKPTPAEIDARGKLVWGTKKLNDEITGCEKSVAPWNRSMLGAGLAYYYSEIERTSSGMISDAAASDGSGFGAWISAAWPIGKPGINGVRPAQITIGGQYTENLIRERTSNDSTINETVDGWRIGAKYVHSLQEAKTRGTTSQAYRGFFEISHAVEKFGLIDDKFTQAGIGIEIQVGKNLFFQAVVGDTFDSEIDRSSYLSGQLKWSFSQGAAN